MLKIYTYAKCSTCRKAVKFLRDHKIAFEEFPIRETPPSVPELKQALAHKDGKVRALFNTSGLDYRALGLGEKLPQMTDAEALNLLAANGNLVKRPFVIDKDITFAGFDENSWKAVLSCHQSPTQSSLSTRALRH